MKLLLLFLVVVAVIATDRFDKEGLNRLFLNTVKDAMDPHMKANMAEYTHEDNMKLTQDLHDKLENLGHSLIEDEEATLSEAELEQRCSNSGKVTVGHVSTNQLLKTAVRDACDAVPSVKGCQQGIKPHAGLLEMTEQEALSILSNHLNQIKKHKGPASALEIEEDNTQKLCIEFKNRVHGVMNSIEQSNNSNTEKNAATNIESYLQCLCDSPQNNCILQAANAATGLTNTINDAFGEGVQDAKTAAACDHTSGLIETQRKTKMGVSYNARKNLFSLRIDAGKVKCAVHWSPSQAHRIRGHCQVYRVIRVSIDINAKIKYIKISIHACVKALKKLEKLLRKIPGMGRFLDKEGIRNGCMYLGHGVYSWGYQNLLIKTRDFCKNFFPFRACAKFEFHMRIKGGGIYPGHWGQRDWASRRCRGCARWMIRRGNFKYETFNNVGKSRSRRRRRRRRHSRRRHSRRRRRRRRYYGLIQQKSETRQKTRGCYCRPWVHFKIHVKIEFFGNKALCDIKKRLFGLSQMQSKSKTRGFIRRIGRWARRAVRTVGRFARKAWNHVRPKWCGMFQANLLNTYFG